MGKFINAIGVEVECGYTHDRDIPRYITKTGEEATSDNYVFKRTGDGSLRQARDVRLIEFVSNVMKWPEDEQTLRTGLNTIYQDIEEINSSMGLHIHFSLNHKGWLSRLASTKFTDYLWERIKQHQLYNEHLRLRERMRGDFRTELSSSGTNYAQKMEEKDQIDRMLGSRRTPDTTGRKYFAVNYFPVNSRDTIEVRIFPAMHTPGHVMDAVDIVTTAVNAYLQKKEYQAEQDIKTVTKPEADNETHTITATEQVNEKHIAL